MILHKGFKLSKNFALSISGLHKIRDLTDGVDFFEFLCNLDLYEGDHNPSFQIMLEVLNIKIFELMIYNVNHRD